MCLASVSIGLADCFEIVLLLLQARNVQQKRCGNTDSEHNPVSTVKPKRNKSHILSFGNKRFDSFVGHRPEAKIRVVVHTGGSVCQSRLSSLSNSNSSSGDQAVAES